MSAFRIAGLMQKASKTKLDMMSGDSFDKSYVKGGRADTRNTSERFRKSVHREVITAYSRFPALVISVRSF